MGKKIGYDYQVAPLALELAAFDVYLVDGRYRVACACMSLLHAMSRGADMSKVMVGVHESNLKRYGVAFGGVAFGKVANVVHKAEKLYVYKLKDGVTEKDIYEVWKDYQGKAL